MSRVSNKAGVRGSADGGNFGWPPATLAATERMVLLLARDLRVADALAVIQRIRNRGMPATNEVQFGLVVNSPLAENQPLAVRHPPCAPSPPCRQ